MGYYRVIGNAQGRPSQSEIKTMTKYYVTLKTKDGTYQSQVYAPSATDAKVYGIIHANVEGFQVLDVLSVYHWGMTENGMQKIEA